MPLGQREGDSSESRYCGAEVAFSDEIHRTLAANLSGGFDFIVAPLTDPSYRPSETDAAGGGAPVPPFSGSDLVLSPAQWSSHVVGRLSSWADFSSSDVVKRADSEAVIKQEVSWASHLSLQACVLPTPSALDSANYARVVNQLLQGLSNMQLWLRIPVVAPELQAVEGSPEEEKVFLQRDDSSGRPLHDSWEWWTSFRCMCEHHGHLSVALDIGASLPPPAAMHRWLGEPVRAAFLHTSAFLTNKKGFPTLSKRHQAVISLLFSHSVQVILSGQPLHPPDIAASSPSSDSSSDAKASVSGHPLRLYLEYLAHLYRRLEPLTEQEKFELGYRDFLQAPLQPLMDNLEAQTYETFEKDATKYSQYQEAIRAALTDRITDEEAEQGKTIVLMVVGAGRGPLVRAALEAAEEAGRNLKVFAVEKNPNAVVTLHSLVALEGWSEKVTVISADMRAWEAPEQADILVSELLGSFGDNELSPECLDGAQRFLKPDGISIPSSYTSFLGPLTSSKLHNDVKAYGDLAHFETAYVVKLHSAARLTDPQPLFTFEHPNWSERIDNTRYKQLTFEMPLETGSTMVHGFGGYFDAVLYKDTHLGIEPSTATPNMFSWFPSFFPLRSPIYVPAGQKLVVHFWRCVGPAKVWYEWAVSTPSVSTIHNPNGRSYFVGL